MPDNYNDAWMQGYATALADMHRLYHNTSEVEQTMVSGGINIRHLTRAQVNSYDVNELKKCVRKRRATAAHARAGGKDGAKCLACGSLVAPCPNEWRGGGLTPRGKHAPFDPSLKRAAEAHARKDGR